MKRKLSSDLWKKFTVGFLAVALIVTGVIFAQPDGSNAQAEVDEQDVTKVEVTKISDYRTNGYTYPQPTEEGKEDYLFAGWYTTEDCTTPYTATTLAAVADGVSVYAKYVPSEILEVKFQAAVDATKHIGNLRVVSTIDVLSYQEVGFEILSVSTGVTKKIPAETVYKRVQCKEDGVEFGYSPIIFDTDSEYFLTGTINNIKDFEKIYSTRAYWVTPDGTSVYGTARNARLSDGYQGIANVPVRLRANADASLGDLQITYNTDAFTYVGYDVYTQSLLAEGATVTSANDTADETKIITTLTWEESQAVESMDGMLVNLRFKINSSAESSNVFEVSSDTLNGGDLFGYTYNALSASYDGGEPDTSWYDNYSEETEFVIATANDLYGLATLVNIGTEDFADNKTVYLGADIIVNTADVETLTKETAYLWTAIGETTETAFAGTFDGDGHTIEGIYYSVTETPEVTDELSYHGLFGVVANGSNLKDFRLENSYFELKGIQKEAMGSIAGQLNGSLEEVYSEAEVYSNFGLIGGLAGQASPTGTESIVNCWYNGNVDFDKNDTMENNEDVGGLVGLASSGTLEIQSCLTTGNVTATFTATATVNNKGIGGFVGERKSSSTLNITNSVMSSKICGQVGTTPLEGYAKTKGTGRGIRLYVGYNDATSITNSCCLADRDLDYELLKDVTQEMRSDDFIANDLKGHVAYSNLKDIINVYDAEVNTTGTWAIRTYSSVVADSVPVPKCFTDDCIDVEWYYNDPTATNFTISTANELYGLASISATDDFAGDTITLADNITLNEGNANDWAAGYTEGLRVWKPIGQTEAFAGTFNGNEKTISGIYMTTDTANAGLFGQISGATILDFRLANSFFESTIPAKNTTTPGSANLGSVIGIGSGTLQGVYSDAIVYSIAARNGGLVGTAEALTMTSCWFDGTVKAIQQQANGTTSTAGLVGYVYDAQIDTCLNTGEVKLSRELIDGSIEQSNTTAGIGGFVGTLNSTSGTVVIVNSLNAAEMELIWKEHATGTSSKNPNSFRYFGTLIGESREAGQTIEKVYNAGKAVVDIYIKNTIRTYHYDADITNGGTGSGTGTYYSDAVTNTSGNVLALYDELATNLWFEGELIDDPTTGSAYWRVREGNLPIPVGVCFGVEP